MNQIDQQDRVIYGVLGLSFLALLLFRSGDLIEGINAQSLITRNASSAARDSRIAEKRFGNCSSGFVLSDGTPNLIEGETPLAKIAQRAKNVQVRVKPLLVMLLG